MPSWCASPVWTRPTSSSSPASLTPLAGLRPRLIKDVEKLPGARILPGRFTAIQQAIGTPRGRGDAGADYLRAFVEDVKARGLVAKAIADHHVVGLTVVPPAHERRRRAPERTEAGLVRHRADPPPALEHPAEQEVRRRPGAGV